MDKPLLTQVQRRWLQEIGIDAKMLAHFSAEPFVETASVKAQEQSEALSELPPASADTNASGESNGQPVHEAAGARQEPPTATLIADLLQRKSLTRRPVAVPAKAALQTSQLKSGGADPESIQGLREHADTCMACGLHEVRGRVVFGEGKEQAVQWMFIGEAPGGFDESAGRPFQGRPGDLLRVMLQSVGIGEEAPAYFTNVLKCRPIGNRSPQPEEIAACLPLLRRQIRMLQPACLVALGRVAAGVLLGREEDLDELRGQVHEYVDEDGRRIPLVVSHHPASLLLHGQLKAEAWRDLNLLVDSVVSASRTA